MKLKSMNLQEEWFIAKDAENVGKSEGWEKGVLPCAKEAFVPSIIQQFFPEYHGVAYYWCKFAPNFEKGDEERVILRFGGADYFAEAWLNSVYLGSYEGGETPFAFDVTDSVNMSGENLLAVRIVNPCDHDIDGMNLMNTPHRNKTVKKSAGSCLNHGGIWYGVTLSALPMVYIEDKFLEGNIHNGDIRISVNINNNSPDISHASISAEAYTKDASCDKIASSRLDISAKAGISSHSLALNIPKPALWSPDDPNLYKIEIEVSTKYGVHRISLSFGFREFCVKDGYFYLNGKKIFLKSSHSGNAFPEGQMMPVHMDQLRRDFIYAKACGLNMIRCISGLFRPEQLDLADEMGLLIYDECFASWCLGYSHLHTWENEEELQQIIKENHPDMPIGDEAVMLKRWVNATENMIRRDRNHPSVVIWGLLNETKNNSVFRTAKDFLGRARELDPSRLVVLSSGRWDFDFTVGSASNPYTDHWEYTWGPDGNPDLWDPQMPHQTVGDNHFYCPAPVSEKNIEIYRNMGKKTPLPFFLSEFGIGANFHVIEEWKHFMQYGHREDLEDAGWLKYQSESFERDFYKFGMDALFPFPESFLKESQSVNADERKRIFDIVRSNPRLVGYSLTGLFDHGMCGEGLWSYWRRWKPGMFDAVSDGLSTLRFCLFATPCSYSGDNIEIEAVLANDGVLKSGTYTADFAIIGKSGVVYRLTEKFELNGDDFATPIIKKRISLDVPEGKYKLCASLKEASPAGCCTELHIFERQPAINTDIPIYAVGANDEQLDVLRERIPSIKPYNGEDSGIIIVAYAKGALTEALIEKARLGATVVFIERGMFFEEENVTALRAVDDKFNFDQHYDWLYHKDYALLSREVFQGIDGTLAPLTAFGNVFAKQSFSTGRVPDKVLCPGFLTGYYKVDGAYASTHALMSYTHGKGEIYLNSFYLITEKEHPVANRILTNFMNMIINSKNKEEK